MFLVQLQLCANAYNQWLIYNTVKESLGLVMKRVWRFSVCNLRRN